MEDEMRSSSVVEPNREAAARLPDGLVGVVPDAGVVGAAEASAGGVGVTGVLGDVVPDDADCFRAFFSNQAACPAAE